MLLLLGSVCRAESTLQDGKKPPFGLVATLSDQEHYSAMIDAFESRKWSKLEREAQVIAHNFPDTPYSREVSYYLGVAYFNRGDYELANSAFTNYLTMQATPKFFESAIRHKFAIAEEFARGKRKHFLGLRTLPNWSPASADAVAIYDEVISAFPHHDISARSLFGKARVLAKKRDYRASIEAYQTLIRRFPKHPLAIESFIGIGGVYFLQAQSEYPDPDYLDLAQINLQKFRSSFPGEEKIQVAEGNLISMQDYYASCFFDTARFYERTKKWGAAKIYYKKILTTYPRSRIAEKSQMRLDNLQTKIDQLEAKRSRR